tara:strand:+ start:3868 stop:4038 length:171 start_codon:yes stop_codon:yes gene_type:complete
MQNEREAAVWHSVVGGLCLFYAIAQFMTDGLPSGGVAFYAAILSFKLAARNPTREG